MKQQNKRPICGICKCWLATFSSCSEKDGITLGCETCARHTGRFADWKPLDLRNLRIVQGREIYVIVESYEIKPSDGL